jgi:hypothetical protein
MQSYDLIYRLYTDINGDVDDMIEAHVRNCKDLNKTVLQMHQEIVEMYNKLLVELELPDTTTYSVTVIPSEFTDLIEYETISLDDEDATTFYDSDLDPEYVYDHGDMTREEMLEQILKASPFTEGDI